MAKKQKLDGGELFSRILFILSILSLIIVSCWGIHSPALAPQHAPQHAPRVKTATMKTTRTAELLQLQMSKEQVESGSFEASTGGGVLGNVSYVQGSVAGVPVTYIYVRYRAENGDIIDRLIPRDSVRLRDDLAPGEAAKVEIEVVKKREASYEDIQKDPKLCYDAHYDFIPDNLPAEECGKHPEDTPEEWQVDSETPTVVHVPKDSVIVTINPNLVPGGAQKG